MRSATSIGRAAYAAPRSPGTIVPVGAALDVAVGSGGPDCRHGLLGLTSLARRDRSPATTPRASIPRSCRRCSTPTRGMPWPTAPTAGQQRRPGCSGTCSAPARGAVRVERLRRQRAVAGHDGRAGPGRGVHRVAPTSTSTRRARPSGSSAPSSSTSPPPTASSDPSRSRRSPTRSATSTTSSPGVVSITQSTELGTLYTVDEVQALGEVAHRYGMTLHMDGARIANAAVALGADVRSFTVDAGVDVLSFGGTKNGMMYGEAVVYLDPDLARSRPVRPQAGHAAPVEDALRGRPVHGAPRRRAVAAQRRSRQRHGGSPVRAGARSGRASTSADHPRSTACSPACRRTAIEPLRAWSPFYDWDPASQQVRWMTSFDTTDEDVDPLRRRRARRCCLS